MNYVTNFSGILDPLYYTIAYSSQYLSQKILKILFLIKISVVKMQLFAPRKEFKIQDNLLTFNDVMDNLQRGFDLSLAMDKISRELYNGSSNTKHI